MHEIISSFRENMFSNGIKAPQILHASGKIERFYIEGDKSGTKNGWYILFADDFPNGVYGHWKTGVTHTWSMRSKEKMTHYERSCYTSQMKAVIQHREQLRMLAQKNVAQLAAVCFHFYKTAKQNHPYLIRKRISPFCARQFEQTLVLPIMDINGSLHSLQFISPEGKKTFLYLKAMESVSVENDRQTLLEIFNKNKIKNTGTDEIAKVKNIYERYGVMDAAREEVSKFTGEARKHLSQIKEKNLRYVLERFSLMLLERNN